MQNQSSNYASHSAPGQAGHSPNGWNKISVDVRPPGLVVLYLDAEPEEEHYRIIDAALDIGFVHTDCPNVYLEFGASVAAAVHDIWRRLIAHHGRLQTCGRIAILLPARVPESEPGPSSPLGADLEWFGSGEKEESWQWIS